MSQGRPVKHSRLNANKKKLQSLSVHYWHSPARQCEWETERASPYMSTYPVFNIQVIIFCQMGE